MTSFVEHYGLAVVFVVIFLEVAGLPFLPGEAALIAAAVLAERGRLDLAATVAVGFAAAVAGAAAGYGIGRWRGRELLSIWGWIDRVTNRAVTRSEVFFEHHGAKAVFIGRFLPVLRATLGWMAGVARMPWWRFLAWNVAGAAAWSLAVSLVAYYLGAAVIDAVQRDAGIGVAVVAGVAVVLVGLHLLRRRLERA